MKLWLRWSWRDLRARWLQVTAIAFIIALGTGVYAGLGSTGPWQQQSFDASYRLLNSYDLRVKFGDSYVESSRLLNVIQSIPHKDSIKHAESRLIAPTLVDASTGEQSILVRGRIVGVDLTDGGPHVNGFYMNGGRALTPGDKGQNTALLEAHFSEYYQLPAEGTIRLPGNAELNTVGRVMSPEYFTIITDEGGIMAEANFAVVFVSLETAQTLTRHPGMANDLVLTFQPGADRDMLRGEIEQTLSTAFPQVAASIMIPADDPVYRALYGGISTDQNVIMLIAGLFLAGATFGAFNLTSRMIEAQRREIGIGLALGLPMTRLASRPLLVAFQIAVLGVLFGLGVGLYLNNAWGQLVRAILYKPVVETPFQLSFFVQAAVLGIVLPFAAALYPVWRAVRVLPIDAIRTGHLTAKGGGLAPFIARVSLPGKSFTQMPIRNVLRAPRRSLLTMLSTAVAITLLVAMLGIPDSIRATIAHVKAEILQNNPRRIEVDLDFFYPVQWPSVEAIRSSPLVAVAEPGIRVSGYLSRGGVKLNTFLDLVNLDSTLWKPTITAGSRHSASTVPGVILAAQMADRLGVKPGDQLTLTHPRRTGLFAFTWVDTPVEVIGIHAMPTTTLTYMDITRASLMGLDGLTNVVQISPVAGVRAGDVQRDLFSQPGIASIQPMAALVAAFESLSGMFMSMMSIVVAAVVILVFLVTFNSTSINVDERAREIATLFAFGLPVRTVTRMLALENLITGFLGALLGIGLGYFLLNWIITSQLAAVLPDVSLTTSVSPATLGLGLVFGIVVVAITPVLNVRRLLRMDIPSALRVME